MSKDEVPGRMRNSNEINFKSELLIYINIFLGPGFVKAKLKKFVEKFRITQKKLHDLFGCDAAYLALWGESVGRVLMFAG